MSNLNIAALHGCRENHRHRFVPEVTRRAMLFWLLSACLLLLPVENAWSADTAASADVVEPSSGSVNAETLNARLKEVESSKSLDEETRSSITEMINKALANLETARNNKVTTEEYIRLRESAPEMTKKIRAVLEEQASVPPEVKLTVTRESPFEDVERELLQEKANLAAVKAKLADIETQLETSKTRPSVIPKTLASTKQARKDLEAERNAPAPEGELAWVTEARRWAQDARLAALRSEINLLDQELLTLPFKV